jgi:formylglycine-generating enzyme required for sulfatase activity
MIALGFLIYAAFLRFPAKLAHQQHEALGPQDRTGKPASRHSEHEGMERIPGGVTPMGINPSDITRLREVFGVEETELFDPEVPRHTATVDTFYMDKYLVTNTQFKKFVESKPFWQPDRMPAGLDNGNYLRHWKGVDILVKQANHPVVNVNWYAAVAYCQWVDKRLPTEAEWEIAAKGGLNGPFPWGDEPADKRRANYSESNIGSTSPVGSYPGNGSGLFDIAGNVWEYMADEWQPYRPDSQRNPIAGDDLFQAGNGFLSVKTRRVIRGGSWGGAPINLWVEYRDSHPPDGARDFVGFRCAQSMEEN